MKSPGSPEGLGDKDKMAVLEDVKTAWERHGSANNHYWSSEQDYLAAIRLELEAHTYLLTAIVQVLLNERIDAG